MSRTTLFVVLLAGAVASAASAQAFTISYLDGLVELQTAKGWTAVAVGDKVAADATVRLSQDGSLELVRDRTRVTLLKPGVYSVAGVSTAGKNGPGGIGALVAQKLQTLVAEKPKSTAAGGVRAEQQGVPDISWVDENDEVRLKAQNLLDERRYAEATNYLEGAIKDAGPDGDTAELSCMLGAAYYGRGQLARSFRALLQVSPSPDAPWFGRYVLLRAQILVDTQNYADALNLLTPFVAAYPTGEAAQVAWLLSGLCQKGLGNIAAAKSALDSGFQLDPGTDTAKLIDQQRRAL